MDQQLLTALFEKATSDEGLSKELTALAARYGIEAGSSELGEDALDKVVGGVTASSFIRVNVTDKEHKKLVAKIGVLGDGSV